MAKCRNNKIGSTPLQLAPQTARISCAWHATIPFPGGCQWRERDAAPKGPTIYKTHRIIVADYFIIALFPGAHRDMCVCVCVCCVLRAALTLFVCVLARLREMSFRSRTMGGRITIITVHTYTHTHTEAHKQSGKTMVAPVRVRFLRLLRVIVHGIRCSSHDT